MASVLPTIEYKDSLVTLLANDTLELVTYRTIQEHADLLKAVITAYPERVAKSVWAHALRSYRRMRGWPVDNGWCRNEADKLTLCLRWIRANARRSHGGHTDEIMDIKRVYLDATASTKRRKVDTPVRSNDPIDESEASDGAMTACIEGDETDKSTRTTRSTSYARSASG